MLRLTLLLCLAAPLASAAQTVPLSEAARTSLGLSSASAELWTEARTDLLAFRLDAAARAFRGLGATDAGASALGIETVALYRALAIEEPAASDRFYALNDSLGRVAARLGDAGGGPLVRATAALHKAILLGREERYARAGLAFKDACGQFRGLDATVPDALFGQGVCESAAGAIPSKYRWLGRLLGFSGTVAGGLDKLDQAARGEGAFAPEAAAAFAVVDASLNERRAGGLDRLRTVAAAQPDSPVLAYLVAFYLLADRQVVGAEAELRRARTALDAPGAAPFPFVDADLGLALFRQDRFAEALPLLDRYVRTFRGAALLSRTTYTAGLAAEMAGDRRTAEAYYARVRAPRDYDSDKQAVRLATLRRAAPMTAAERTLLLGQNAYDSDRLDEAIYVLQPVLTDASLPDADRAEAAYRTGRAYQAQENDAEAIRHFELAVANPGDPLARWGPWSIYHIGEIQEDAGNAAAAREAYQLALDAPGEFDFRTALEQRAKTALARLGR